MGNKCLEMVEYHGVQTIDGVVSEIKRRDRESLRDDLPDLQELTVEEIQEIRDTDEDDEFDDNIDKVGRDGDLSPRKLKILESGTKRSKSNQNIVPLQVKTRSSRERSEDIFQ